MLTGTPTSRTLSSLALTPRLYIRLATIPNNNDLPAVSRSPRTQPPSAPIPRNFDIIFVNFG
ncbi:hypothetical protein BDR03DRAFT_948897, partial [Suillus americanus]